MEGTGGGTNLTATPEESERIMAGLSGEYGFDIDFTIAPHKKKTPRKHRNTDSVVKATNSAFAEDFNYPELIIPSFDILGVATIFGNTTKMVHVDILPEYVIHAKEEIKNQMEWRAKNIYLASKIAKETTSKLTVLVKLN